MSETVSRDPIVFGGKKVSMYGKFKLTSNKPAAKLHLTNIDAFVPVGKTIGEKIYFYDVNGKTPFLFIDKKETIFNPDISDIDALNVQTLIQHPDVRLVDMSEAEHMELARRGLKKENPEFTLVNLDKAILDQHEEDIEMIEIKWLITNRNKPLSKKKLMYIASSLGISTRSEIQDEKRYIASLQRSLSKFLEGNPDSRDKFKALYENIAEAEVMYFINEFIELGYVVEYGGIFKIEDKPIGFKIENVKEWFAANETTYEALKLKVQEYHSDKVTK